MPQFTIRPPTSKTTYDQPPVEDVRKIPRPTTARAAPPKVVRRDDEVAAQFEQEEKQRIANAQPVANLITESGAAGGDEDEFVVGDVVPAADDDRDNDLVANIAHSNEEKGYLVKQLVETKRELEGDRGGSAGGGGEEPMMRLAGKEIEKLRQSIQTLSRLANPLGRVLEYLQEDVDTMVQELNSWLSEVASNNAQLEKARTTIDDDLRPLKDTLDDLEREMNDVNESIAVTKAAVIRRQERFARMLSMVVERA